MFQNLDKVQAAGKAEMQEVLVASRDINISEALDEENVRVASLPKSVVQRGALTNIEDLDNRFARVRLYPGEPILHDKVINGIEVGGVQQVALQVKVMEVSRTKLRQFGLAWAFSGDDGQILQGAGGLSAQAYGGDAAELVPRIGGDTVRLKLFGDASPFIAHLQALRADGFVKVLAEPTLVTVTGRPASFDSGGSFPILVPNGLGTVGIEYKKYSTRVDFVPIVLDNGNIRLEVRRSVSELDNSRGVDVNDTTVPGVTDRTVETSVEMKAGQTLALAGLIQSRVEAQKRGIPYLGDLPWVGRAFSSVEEISNEVELLIVVTPELVGPLNRHQVPQCGPGEMTTSPNDHELYDYRHLEVPNSVSPAMPYEGDLQPPMIDTGTESSPRRQTPVTPSFHANRGQPRTNRYLPASQHRREPATTPSRLYGPLGYDPLY